MSSGTSCTPAAAFGDRFLLVGCGSARPGTANPASSCPVLGGIVSSVSSPGSSASNRKPIAIVLGVLAVVFIVVGLIFAIKGHHELRTAGGFIVGLICAGGAWVALAYKPKPKAVAQDNVPAGRN